MPSAHINKGLVTVAAVQGDDRLSGRGNSKRPRCIKAGAGNVQDSISGFFDSQKGPEGVVRMGDGLRHLVCSEFDAPPVGGYYGDTGGAFSRMNAVIFTMDFISRKVSKTRVSIQNAVAFLLDFLSDHASPQALDVQVR